MVEVKLVSKRYCCTLNLENKVTVISGDSGVGKSEFVKRVLNRSRANKITISNGYDMVVLTGKVFKGICDRAKRDDKGKNLGKYEDMRGYWEERENFPYSNSIIIIDDEDFVRSEVFSTFLKADKYNYYIIMYRGDIPRLGHTEVDSYRFIREGMNHYIEKREDRSYGKNCKG